MAHTMTIEQIGSKGTIYGVTSFGFAFTANYVEPDRRKRVIEVLSFCCQSSYMAKDGKRVCFVCEKVSDELLQEDYSREYPDFEGDNLNRLERIVSRGKVDSLEAIILADGIAQVLDNFWEGVASGKRTREVLKDKRFLGEIEL